MLNGKLTHPGDEKWSVQLYCEQNKLDYNPDGKAEMMWVDTETTGLNDGEVNRDRILEFASVATTTDLEVVDVFHTFVWNTAWRQAFTKMSANVYNMHVRSNLAEELMECVEDPGRVVGLDREQIERRFAFWAVNNGFELSSSPMFGNTVSFDRGMLKQDLPGVLDYFHYRNVDVSSLKELIKRWNKPAYEDWEDLQPPVLSKEHRALLDLSWSIRELKFYRSRFLIMGA